MPTPITSTVKKVAKPSTITMLANDVPGSVLALIAAASAAANATSETVWKAVRLFSPSSGSISITSVPATVMMISGRNRM